MIHWQVKVGDPKLLRDFLVEKGVSRRIIGRTKFHGGHFLVNDRKVRVSEQLFEGDNVTLVLPPEPPNDQLLTSDLPLDILFEDDTYLFINKPAGLISTPSRIYKRDTVAARVKSHLIKQDAPHQVVHTVTRLDRYTSGVILVAKNALIHSWMGKLLENNAIDREYLAIVKGELDEVEGVIEEPIGRSPDSIIERMITPEGQYAKTSYQVLAKLEGYTLVAAKLHTGRTHQIRVHFDYLGHPLLGDDLYDMPSDLISRQALHCWRLSFVDPLNGSKIIQTAPIPEDMKLAIQTLGGVQWLEEDSRKNKKE